MRGKTYRAAKEQVGTDVTDVKTAVVFLKEQTRSSFDETVELHINLGVDPTKSDQMVRGSVVLPAGSPREQRIAVLTDDATTHKNITAAGAALVGGEDLIASINESGSIDADVVVATPTMMPKVAAVAKVLGPIGLMPNPKTGTVSDDPVAVVKELMAGKFSYKMDQLGNVHVAVAKASWDIDKIEANVSALLENLKTLRPSSAKGDFLRSVTLCTTMGPAVKVSA